MKALCWYGKHDVRISDVPDPKILNPRDAVIRVSLTSICGSDLHLFDGYVLAMEKGDILGHEFMGEVVEIGPEVKNLNIGDRVVVPFPISCGRCWFCNRQEYSLCDNSNPNAGLTEMNYGYSGAAIFGYSHLFGGYAGGQAEYVRVPFADVGPLKIPSHLPDEKVLFLSDVFPTGYQAAEYCSIHPGDTVAVWGCGPVGQFAILSARLLGAERVIAVDRFPERLALAAEAGKAETVNYEDEESVLETLREMTAGRGPDACIDAVGLEAHGFGVMARIDKALQTVRMQTDRPTAFREAVQACRKGGTVSIPGVYGNIMDKINMGSAFNKGLTFRMGQTHVQKYMPELLRMIEENKVDPSFIISHRLPLEQAPYGYEIFKEKKDACTKIVLQP